MVQNSNDRNSLRFDRWNFDREPCAIIKIGSIIESCVELEQTHAQAEIP
ncbi:MAG: hypothetical protein HC936_08560 [Leptolyngbyaceae cyanobacterium SU_3_3]|nr:hypothetical protein [Leptolyngbyaceae cyanobacterium SU_3_3]NJR49742.1 hypothetical protein [Leptolyngbyaceae cyanobacterium CSU_1_3]